MAWHRELLVGFDLETTGTDPFSSRIVTAAVTEVKDEEPVRRREWLVDPGIPIPAEATAVHGITTEHAAEYGSPAPEAADQIAEALAGYWAKGVPVIVYNAPFDLSLLAAEVRRYGLPSLNDRLGGGDIGPVVDPLIIDRSLDRYRKGKRTLEAACAVYGVALDGAHEAGADALAAARVACALAERFPRECAGELWELHRAQAVWYADWAADHSAWLRRSGRGVAADIDADWPLREAG
jgi:DNA polymerase III subunit epsilon